MPEYQGQDALICLLIFFGAFGVMAGLEKLLPRRVPMRPKAERWMINIMITAINTLIIRFAMPILPVGAALVAQQNGWGILNMLPQFPDVAVWALGLMTLDLIVYLQHVAFHRVPLLWRLHRVHHCDLDVDVTTGLRFHPIEIVLSLTIRILAVLALGIPAPVVLAFEVILITMAVFNHANVAIPRWLDGFVRLFVVTPDMHRVHHSTQVAETNSNYGFNLSCWDRLLRTYCAQPKADHAAMSIGLPDVRDPSRVSLPALMIAPFQKT